MAKALLLYREYPSRLFLPHTAPMVPYSNAFLLFDVSDPLNEKRVLLSPIPGVKITSRVRYNPNPAGFT